MHPIQSFEQHLPPEQRAVLKSLDSPFKIQAYLDNLPYMAVELDRSPLRVMTDGQAHCLDGGLFGALALWRLGHRPLILDLVPESGLDDDHVLALYQHEGRWGCVAKSNYACLRFRDPVFRDLHELAISFFEFYFTIHGEKSLRGYTRPLNLERLAHTGWLWSETGVNLVTARLYRLKPIPLFPAGYAPLLSPADERAFQATNVGTNLEWSFGIRKNK